MNEKDRLKWSEALRRLSLLMSGSWAVQFMGCPYGPGTDQDYVVRLINVMTSQKVHAYGPDLASTVTKAVNKAAKYDATFQGVEEQIVVRHLGAE
jgi:hypothetical protein